MKCSACNRTGLHKLKNALVLSSKGARSARVCEACRKAGVLIVASGLAASSLARTPKLSPVKMAPVKLALARLDSELAALLVGKSPGAPKSNFLSGCVDGYQAAIRILKEQIPEGGV